MEQEPAKGNVVMMLIDDGLEDHCDGRLNVVYFGWCNKCGSKRQFVHAGTNTSY
jgi:hypothetical protein